MAMKLLTRAKEAVQRRTGNASEPGSWVDTVSRTSVLPDAIPFQDPIDEIVEEQPPRHMRSTYYLGVLLFLIALLVAAVVNVDIVVVGSGKLMTNPPPFPLQPIDRAIIREINVKVGDSVTKGQVLATLDPTFAKADLASLSGQQGSLLAQMRRLEAEMNGTPYQPLSTASADDLLQANLYRQRQAQYASQLRVFDEEIQRRRANIRTTEDERAANQKQLVIAKDVEQMRASMAEKQVGSRLNYLEAQSARMRIEQQHQDAENRLNELQHELKAKEAERQSFIDNWHQNIIDSMISARNEANRIGESMNKATLLNDMVVVTAPEDGVVLDVAKVSVGSILREAEPLLTIVKSNADMLAEIMINSADVGYAKSGDDVVIKVDSFPYQRHGMMKGKLLTISEESFAGGGDSSTAALPNADRGGSGIYHRAMVQLTDTTLDSLPDGARLIPGMTLRGEIKVGSRSVLSYFLNPITRGLSESIREP